ncbi:MAG: hypothetical protein ABSB13_13555, partial [Candidatus Binatus sp.]|uniref:hypothetical protein n=1 Tax=Candidatus Binatus sp. TaxID=2811406 RepID=UPI003D0DD6A4
MAGILSARNENGSLRRSGQYSRSTIAASAKFQSISFEGSGETASRIPGYPIPRASRCAGHASG